MNIEAKFNTFKLSMILARNRKRVNIVTLSEQLDWLMSWMSEVDETHFVSGRQILGRLKERLRQISRGFYSHISEGEVSVSNA